VSEREGYTREEVDEILKRALCRQEARADKLDRSEIVEAAGELGIGASDVDAAIREVEKKRATFARMEVERAWQKRKLARAAAIYVVLTAFLLFINLRSGGPSWWYWAAAGWGLAIAVQAIRVWMPSEKDEARIRCRERRRERRMHRDEDDARFEQAVERGVEQILERVRVSEETHAEPSANVSVKTDADARAQAEEEAQAREARGKS
jgi:hypothetical protein